MSNEEIMNVVKPAICSKLKCPASAKFPVDLISIVGDDERGYKINGFVDSQNSFGAMIRNDFIANVIVEDGFPKLKTCSLAAKANAERAKIFGANYILISIVSIISAAIIYFIISLIVGM